MLWVHKRTVSLRGFFEHSKHMFKGIYYCLIEIIKGLTDKGQFQYLIKLFMFYHWKILASSWKVIVLKAYITVQ